ncbi:MAG: hypothetical protein ABH821_03465 [archaeon]
MASVSMNTVYKELKSLRKEIEVVKYALMPVEKISFKERKQIRRIRKEMESGKRKSFEEVFGC